MSTSNLPPLRNLPNWSRVSTLDKSRYPRLFPKVCPSNASHLDSTVKDPAHPTGMDPGLTRIVSLEKDVIFLQQQHKETLGKLHKEIDALKRENKELQYKLIMETNQLSKQESLETASPLEVSRGSEWDPCQCADDPALLPGSHSVGGALSTAAECDAQREDTAMTGGSLVSLSPLRVHRRPEELPRAPTLRECELIIQQLCQANKLQAQELVHLRTTLKDIVLNKKKVTPEAYSQTKAYLTDCPREGSGRFPKITQKSATKRLPQAQASDGERLVFPSIRSSCNSLMERQKRAQATHKTRLRKAVDS